MEIPSNSPPRLEPENGGHAIAKGRVWGSFQLLELVGRGGFGEVFRAWDPQLQREIALKLLLKSPAGGDQQFAELLREARALASVRHPNIVSIYGVDRHDGRVGFWTDFVHGKTLSLVVREQGPFGYREAALVGLDVSKALSAVHRAGLLHRDIKAENVMREAGGRILLMDFGLTTLSHLHSELSGTPRYMAPELFAGASASVASDIYAVGVLLFHLVTGQYPAQSTSMSSPTVSQPSPDLNGDEATADVTALPSMFSGPSPSRSLVDFRPDLPEAFARLVDVAIHPDPSRRFTSAGALATALSEVVAGPAAVTETAGRVASRPKRMPQWIYAAALAAILLASVGTLAYLRHVKATPGAGKSPATLSASAGVNDEYMKADALLLRYDKQKNVTDAIGLLNDVLKQDPDFALAQAGLGRASFLEYRVTRAPGLLDQAQAACNRAIAIDASLAPPHITLARIYAMTGKTALATQEVQKALHLDPRSAEAYGVQSEVFDNEGRRDDAIASVQQAITMDPDYWRWPVWLGNYYYADGKLEDAAKQYSKAVKLTPDNAIALLDLGLTSLQLGRLDDARTNLEESARIQPSFAAYSTLAEVLTSEGKFTEAVEESKKALELSPDNYLAWGNLASAYLWSPGGHDKAMETYRKAIELAEGSRKETPNDPSLLAALGGYYAVTGHSARSVPLLRQAVALSPENPNVLFLAGDGYELLHDRSDAISLIAKSLALGYHANQLQRSPELASLRADPAFQQALRLLQAKQSIDKSSETR